jgi:hypothetical protein
MEQRLSRVGELPKEENEMRTPEGKTPAEFKSEHTSSSSLEGEESHPEETKVDLTAQFVELMKSGSGPAELLEAAKASALDPL